MNGLNRFAFAAGPCCYLEIGQSRLEALSGEAGLELPLERASGGRLTAACKERLARRLQDFLKGHAWRGRARALCAIGARGVALRRLRLPAVSKEDLQRVLRLQIESEFPLPPDEMAWGYRALDEATRVPNGPNGQREFLVVAVKKEVVEEYAEVLSACGVTPVFTLAALARNYLCPAGPGDYAILDLGREQSELIAFENGVPASVRVLPWGSESLTRAPAGKLPPGRDDTGELKAKLGPAAPPGGDGEPSGSALVAFEQAVEALARALNVQGKPRQLFLSGKAARQTSFVAALSQRLGPGVSLEVLEQAAGEGRSAAVLGLRRAMANGGVTPLLTVQVKPTNGGAATVRPVPWQWLGLAALLVLALAVMPYAEALALKPRLEKKLAALKAEQGRLPLIDQKWDFLEHLKQNQPPYLDALFLLAKSAPPGARIDSLAMSRRGELTLRGSLQNPTQVADFRSKLIASGFFEHVIIDEQTPSPDRQKLSLRLTAQWKPLSARQTLALAPTKEEIEKARTRVRNQPGPGGPGMMPPMMPPGAGGPGGVGVVPGGLSGPGSPRAMGPRPVLPGNMPASPAGGDTMPRPVPPNR